MNEWMNEDWFEKEDDVILVVVPIGTNRIKLQRNVIIYYSWFVYPSSVLTYFVISSTHKMGKKNFSCVNSSDFAIGLENFAKFFISQILLFY